MLSKEKKSIHSSLSPIYCYVGFFSSCCEMQSDLLALLVSVLDSKLIKQSELTPGPDQCIFFFGKMLLMLHKGEPLSKFNVGGNFVMESWPGTDLKSIVMLGKNIISNSSKNSNHSCSM